MTFWNINVTFRFKINLLLPGFVLPFYFLILFLSNTTCLLREVKTTRTTYMNRVVCQTVDNV